MLLDKYDPEKIEAPLVEAWEKAEIFNPNKSPAKKTYTLVIPPPNVTGSLHIGHALSHTLQDILVRFYRMRGRKTLWLPGTDHAGIATQVMVEKYLRTKGIAKDSLSKEDFLAHIWEWKERSSSQIKSQMRRIGCSLDWSRERFTLDDMLSKAVDHAFVNFFNKGLIYKGKRLVNWCPVDKTALSDLEVDHIELKGKIYSIDYALEDGAHLTVATTRPETLLGDVALAVNPADKRYQHLIGQQAIVPIVRRKVPIIADEACDFEFGTGVLKITPAHDFADFEIAARHQLKAINIFNEDATLNDVYPPLSGLDRFKARTEVLKILQKLKLLRDIKDHIHMVAHSQRQKSIIEPRLSNQWFFDVKPLADKVLDQIEQGNFKVYPKNQQTILKHWLTNIQSWCISRQLWWGHRIPAFFCQHCKEYHAFVKAPESCPKCNRPDLVQDNDVLDTWFSSGVFPFATMGWPDQTIDLEVFYPNSSLLTAYDILFFWVARMAMMGIELTGKLPFPETYTHGLIRDSQGRKMSKTAGNEINPSKIIQEQGADSLRIALCMNSSYGQDVKLADSDIVNAKLFLNKLLNAAKFVKMCNDKFGYDGVFTLSEPPTLIEAWMLHKLQLAVHKSQSSIKKYRFYDLGQTIYQLMWRDFCDTYLEIAKARLFNASQNKAASNLKLIQQVLNTSLQQILRIIHPVAPFLSEHIFQSLYPDQGFLAAADYNITQPDWGSFSVTLADDFLKILSLIRSVRGENNIHPKDMVKLKIKNSLNPDLAAMFIDENLIIESLAKVSAVEQVADISPQLGWADFSFNEVILQLEIPENVSDIELKRVKKVLSNMIERKESLVARLSNADFLSKAPLAIVDKTKAELAQLDEEIKRIQQNTTL